MRKILAFCLAILLILSMAVPAFAVTPKLKVPNVPQISKIQIKPTIQIKLSDDFWDNWFKEHPIKWGP